MVEKDAVFIPAGWDNDKKISILYENMHRSVAYRYLHLGRVIDGLSWIYLNMQPRAEMQLLVLVSGWI